MTLLFNSLSVESGFMKEIGKLNRKVTIKSEASEMTQQGEPCARKFIDSTSQIVL